MLGFLTICSGVVLLQLSKSAKDVPDTAVFRGDLDQIQTIAEQEQPETEPKADAIRGTAALVRRISQARMKMEASELQRLHEEKSMDALGTISEDGQPQYEWDGLRRRKTLASSVRGRSATSPGPAPPFSPPPPSPHPPLGMSSFPTQEEWDENSRPSTMFSSIVGTIRSRARTNATMPASYGDDLEQQKMRSPGIRPVPLTEIMVPKQNPDDEAGTYYGQTREHRFDHDTEYRGASAGSGASLAPTPPPHGARRQFSFNRVFRKTPDTTEEERLGLVVEAHEDFPDRRSREGGMGMDGHGDDENHSTDDDDDDSRYDRGKASSYERRK